MKTKLRKRVQFETTGPSLTKQAHADECNVNSILEKYRKTGHISHIRSGEGSYGDFTSVNNYQESINQVIEAQNAFYELPAIVRKRFGNDPQQLMDFIQNDENYEEAVKLGLISPEVLAKRAQNDDQTTKQAPAKDDKGENQPQQTSK